MFLVLGILILGFLFNRIFIKYIHSILDRNYDFLYALINIISLIYLNVFLHLFILYSIFLSYPINY